MSDWDSFQRRRVAEREAMLAVPVLAVRHHADIRPPLEDQFLIAAAVTVRQELVAVWSSRAGASDRADISDATSPVAASATVVIHDPSARVVCQIDTLPVKHPLVDVLPDGHVLIVGARAGRSGTGAEHNAFVYDGAGIVIAEGTLGDGIEHVQTTSAGEIWVGYFDEGIYGLRGTESNGLPSLASSGLATFDSDLRQVWSYPSHVEQPWGAISDCYALNVSDEVTWTCYYTDFPVVRISKGAVTSWTNPTSGARAMVAADDCVALAGGYQPHRDRLVIGHLDAGEVDTQATRRLVLPDGAPLPTKIRAHGRGSCLHFLDGKSWFRLDPLD